MQRGELWWAALPAPTGSGPGYRRPVLIVQSNDFNRSRIQTVLAVIITSNLRLAKAPGNVLIRASRSGLPKDSVANVSQLITVDKQLLRRRVKKLSDEILQQVDDGLRLVLSL